MNCLRFDAWLSGLLDSGSWANESTEDDRLVVDDFLSFNFQFMFLGFSVPCSNMCEVNV